MQWKSILVAIAASGWFFPVSCTTSLYAGVRVVSAIDARHVSEGESVHSRFSYVVETNGEGEPFYVGDLHSLAQHEEMQEDLDMVDSVNFLMSRPSGRLDGDDSRFSYRVIEHGESEQIIEVVEAFYDGDNTIWSRYKATRTSITPISTRMMYFGYLFSAFPVALGIGFLIYGAGRYLQHKQRKSISPRGAA
jgi:hypothetical protein